MKKKINPNLTNSNNNKINTYTTSIYQIQGFYSLLMHKHYTSVTHFMCKNTSFSLLPGDLASTDELHNTPFLLSFSMHNRQKAPPEADLSLGSSYQEGWRQGALHPADCQAPCMCQAANPSSQHHPRNPAMDIRIYLQTATQFVSLIFCQ